ncbi:BPL-N domain-containing protein [Xanthomonas sacchari]
MKLPLRLAALCCLAFACVSAANAQPTIRVAVYRGAAGCDDCSETAKEAIEALSPQYKVDIIGPKEAQDVTPATLRGYAIYVQPGGGQDIPAALQAMGERRIAAIRDFVAQGGGYLGLCMGAYLADDTNMGLIGDDLDGEVGRPGFPVTTIDEEAVAVRWKGRPDSVFFQDGPYFPKSTQGGFRALATYANGDVAAARYSFGRGTVVLSGPHPEADRSWFEQAEIPLDKMPRTPVLQALFDEFALPASQP